MGLKRWEVFTPPLLSASLAWPLGSVCRPGRPFTAPVITVTVWVHYEQECLNHTGAATKAPAEHCPQYSCTSHCKHSHASQSSLKRRGYSAQFGVYSLSLSHSLNVSHSRSPSLHSRAVLGSRLYTRSPGFPNTSFQTWTSGWETEKKAAGEFLVCFCFYSLAYCERNPSTRLFICMPLFCLYS